MTRLTINPIGGLANRMRAIASGIALADSLGIGYRVVWLKNWELGASFDHIFDIPDCLAGKITEPGKIAYNLAYTIPRKKNLYLSSFMLRRFGATLFANSNQWQQIFSGADPTEKVRKLVENAAKAEKDSFIQAGTEYFPYNIDQYRLLFRPTEEIKRMATDTLERLGTSRRIGIHIRRSDNAMSILHSPDELFIAEIKRILAESPDAKFYMATDDERTKHQFKQIFGNRIVATEKPATRGTVDGIKQAAAEMFALAGTEQIIGSYYSSFSEAAAMLGGIELRQLYSEH